MLIWTLIMVALVTYTFGRRENASCPGRLAVLTTHGLLQPHAGTEDDGGR